MYGYNQNGPSYPYGDFLRGGRYPRLMGNQPVRFTSPQGFVYGRSVRPMFTPNYDKNLAFTSNTRNGPHSHPGKQELFGNSLVVYHGNNKRSHNNAKKADKDEPQRKKQKQADIKSQPGNQSLSHTPALNDKITESIWRYYQQYRQSDLQYRQKVDLRDAIYAIFKDVFPYCGLYMVGSSMSGFATKTSDMDLCLMLSPNEIDGKREAVEILMAIQRALRKCRFIRRSQVIRARVPILKFEDFESGTECDLNINNAVGIRNTHLLRYYAAMDWRVRPLVLYVKKWARFHDINDASKKTVSSYSLCLMVIHYLQYGCSPPVLDSVQKLYPDLFDYGEDIRNLKMNVQIEFKSKNSSSIGDLFMGFLEYYSTYDYDNDVVSVRLGCKIPLHMVLNLTPINEQKQWTCLKIEEPFDRSNTARSCFDVQTFSRVQHIFNRSSKRLKQTRDPESILSVPF